MTYLLIGIAAFFVSGAVSYFITLWIQRRAHRSGWLDEPADTRKIHDEATPTVGGLAIAGGVVGGAAILLLGSTAGGLSFTLPHGVFWAGALIMLVTGFVDDVHGASFKKKFFIQSAVAYGLLHFGYGVDVKAFLPFEVGTYHATLLTVPLTMGWVVGVMNAVNFIDGLDGLAAGVVLIALATFGALFGVQGEWGLLMTAVVSTGALLGFLRYNFYPATIFMGDSGSLLLGYLAAVFPLVAPLDGHAVVNVLVPVVVLGLPLLDTMTSIARRIVNRQSIFVPDKDHIHHRLLRRFPEPDAVGGMYLASAWFGLAAVLMVVVPPFWAYLTFGTTAVVSVAWVVRLGYFDVRMPTAAPLHSASADAAQVAPPPRPPGGPADQEAEGAVPVGEPDASNTPAQALDA
ncbi:MAG: undecaprenyl/decaprenyl-phosphate alpha-N-acetylglucosaminyl 1-phosphate transferase [Bacteroidetes bacterium]|jgi:UDP-GlcNAc:undecaprenyl-phosphate GlcNAc-1-phosphate transferase|nr:undecaprenyl/decaprenyl-phosphate alpha-N-acetylglucosaminyl 1-phosphate transferase [Bacteroidota bacterium]